MKTKLQVIAKVSLVSLILTAATVQGAAPAVLSEIPSDAELVLVTQPLTTISAKVDLFARAAGIVQEAQPAFKVEDMLAAHMGIPGMIDSSRGVGVAVTGLGDMENILVAFFPVDNAQAVVQQQQLQPVADAPGLWQIPGNEVFVKPQGKYLQVCPNKTLLQNLGTKPKGYKLDAADEALLGKSEAIAVIKLGSVLPELRKEALQEIEQTEDLQGHPGLKKVINMGLDRLAEVEKISAGLSIGKDGIKLSAVTRARTNSTLAKYLVAQPKTNAKDLAKLPAGKYISAATYRINQKTVEAPVFAILDALAEEITQQGQDPSADLMQLKSLLSQVYGACLSDPICQAQYVSSSAPAAPGSMQMIQISSVKSVKQTLEISQKIYPLLSKLIQQAGYNLPMTYKTNAGKVEGLSYDEFSFDLSGLPIPEEALMAIAQQWGGKAAMTQQYCAIDAERLATAMGSGSLAEAVQLAKSSSAGLNTDPGIVKTAQNLSSPANVLMFLDVSNNLQAIMSQMMSAGPQGGMNPMMMFMPILGQIKGTVGISATLEQGRASAEVFIPTEVIQSAYAAYMQMMMQMMQPPPGATPPAEPGQQQGQTF